MNGPLMKPVLPAEKVGKAVAGAAEDWSQFRRRKCIIRMWSPVPAGSLAARTKNLAR